MPNDDALKRGEEERFYRRFASPEEDRCRLYPERSLSGSYRWFRSPNVVDLYRYRSTAEKARITARLLTR